MAGEALALEYLFEPQSQKVQQPEKVAKDDVFGNLRQNDPGTPFIHFALHDIESAWWTSVWTAFYRHSDRDKAESESDKSHRRDSTTLLFPETSHHSSRTRFLQDEKDFHKRMNGWMSEHFFAFIAVLLTGARLLMALYAEVEATFLQGISALAAEVTRQHPCQPAFPGAPKDCTIYTKLRPLFQEGLEELDCVRLIPFEDADEEDKTERARADGVNGRKRKSEGSHGCSKRLKTLD